MKVVKKVIGHIAANCYMLSTDKGAVIIDPGKCVPELVSFFEENRDKKLAILLTHGHFDHIVGAKKLKDMFGAEIAVHEADAGMLSDTKRSLSDMFRAGQEPCDADILLHGGDTLTVGDMEFSVISTPGHTKGSVCFCTENMLFSGDTLMRLTIGRTDFGEGDEEEMRSSLNMLCRLPDDVRVFPGHGDDTGIGFEKRHNPFIAGGLL